MSGRYVLKWLARPRDLLEAYPVLLAGNSALASDSHPIEHDDEDEEPTQESLRS